MTAHKAKRTATVAAILVACLTLSSCALFGGTETADDKRPDLPQGEFPVTVTDSAGRSVTLDEVPRRIISLAPSNTEILFAIGAGDRVVGTDDRSDYPKQVGDVPRVGDTYGLSFETILSLEPDLVLVIDGMKEDRDRLLEMGLTVVVIQPVDFDGILDSILMVGDLTGETGAARALVDTMRSEAADIASAVSGVPQSDRPLVFVEIWDDPLMTVGPGGFVHELVEMAGGVNLAADADMEWFMIEEEVIIERDPDVIVTFFPESYNALIRGNRPGWSTVSAVSSGRVHAVDSDLLVRPGPRIVLGLRELTGLLHPDRIN